MLELKVNEEKGPSILVIGVGGGGNNAVNRMIEAKLKGVHFAAVNTDVAVLDNSLAEHKIQIGAKLLNGYGAGANPSIGEEAAKENEDDIRKLIEHQDMVIITCGMGGGTGTGAAPFIAKCCKESNILTLGVVTTPFSFEGKPRAIDAESGIANLREHVDTLIIIPNEKLITISDKPLLLDDAFDIADSVLKDTIQGISNIVYNCGDVNIDYNDVKTSLSDKGIGHFGIGKVDYDGSILDAVKQAVNCPLLDTSITGAENILINTSGKVSITALGEALNYVRELAGNNVNIIWGTVTEENNAEDQIVVSIFATGMPEKKEPSVKPPKDFINDFIPHDNNTLSKNAPLLFEQPKEIIAPIVQQPQGVVVPPFLSDYSKKKTGSKTKSRV